MGRKKTNKSLVQQAKECLDSKLAIGKSKYLAKLGGNHTQFIYSWDTYRSYLKHACYFVKWCKAQETDATLGHKPRTLDECRIFAESWIKHELDRGLSAYTIKLELSALAKLYGCTTRDFKIATPSRKRQNITRSRRVAARDRHFSVSENKDLITFCKCTGLRRSELAQIRGSNLIIHDSRFCIEVNRNTKGGRPRISPVVGSDEEIDTVKRLCAEAGEGRVFPKPNRNADIHSFRAAYAAKVYEAHKREVSDFKNERLIVYKNKIIESYISKNGKRDVKRFEHLYTVIDGKSKMLPGYRDVSSAYYCRTDRKGVAYDRRALFEVSKALGHNRETVVADHYLYM